MFSISASLPMTDALIRAAIGKAVAANVDVYWSHWAALKGEGIQLDCWRIAMLPRNR